ncbi:hypothetical protein V3C99_015042 [Haemonchus contortus]
MNPLIGGRKLVELCSIIGEMIRWVLHSLFVSSCFAVTCYDCYGTGPDHAACTKDRSCTGLACMIFDAGDDNNTMTAFCLLAMKDEKIEQKSGCWLEPDGRGRHCMCYTDFCNRLVDKSKGSEKPTYPILPDAQFLKHNPLLDYHDHNSDSSEGDGAVPMPENVMFPGAMTADPRTAGSVDDEDLVPIDFAEYDREWKEKNEKQTTTDIIPDRTQDVTSSARLPSWMLMTMTLATSVARLLVHL